MKIFEAIKLLDDDRNILVCDKGHQYHKYNEHRIMVRLNLETLKDNTTAFTIENDELIEKFKDSSFEQRLQWFQLKNLNLPRLCYVKVNGWSNPKIVMINYFSGTMFSTGYGESYIPSYHTTITPLTDDEIEALKSTKESKKISHDNTKNLKPCPFCGGNNLDPRFAFSGERER